MQSARLDTPILLIIFNKPVKTQIVFDQIKLIKPKKLFVAADGYKNFEINHVNLVDRTRAIVHQVDWECELKLNFRKENLGCGLGPSNAITWFFSQVEEGIILEDDCLPHKDFFWYCQELLQYYRNDIKIMSVGGVNFQNGKVRGKGSYYYSLHNAIWGWATWKRVWNNYDYTISYIEKEQMRKILQKKFLTKSEENYWMGIFDIVKKNRMNDSCWDYQFMFMIWMNNGLAILPNVNLVTNIGFDQDATHTFDSQNPCANIPTRSILPIKHPALMIHDRIADLYYHKTCLQPNKYGYSYFYTKLKKIFKKISIL
ncbi:hypothetical protein [Larkinella punicea]|uniref:Nucleotide-diphospho-sugar transferase n=1 Tax=Larkinella punicea TaxID=2315727 RepID=A0A368JK16_9BACT|nr:hypothetical protein [Larkinella punicea]RCR67625.1 hypothetical protein DUE52_21215 [Larkinella punicea]